MPSVNYHFFTINTANFARLDMKKLNAMQMKMTSFCVNAN